MGLSFLPETVNKILAEKEGLVLQNLDEDTIELVQKMLSIRDRYVDAGDLELIDSSIAEVIITAVEVEPRPQWGVLPPDKPGDWWFYGSWLHHNRSVVLPDEIIPMRDVSKVERVTVETAGEDNHLIGIMKGKFVSLRPSVTGMEGSGYVGFWMKATTPKPPSVALWNSHYGDRSDVEI